MGVSQRFHILEFELEGECVFKVVESRAVLFDSAVVAGEIVIGDGAVVAGGQGQQLGLLEEHVAQVVLLLLQEDHGHQVADLAQLVGGPVVLLALLSEGVLLEH